VEKSGGGVDVGGEISGGEGMEEGRERQAREV